VDIVVGDTDITPEDMGVWGDRSLIFAGTAATMAAEVLKEKIVRLAAHLLNVPESSVELSNGSIFEHGCPENGFTVEEFANIATYGDQNNRPEDLKSGVSLIGEARFETQEGEFMDENGTGSVSHVYTFSSAAVIVEVDLSTGEIDIVDMAIAEDAGTIINPKLAAGQVQGAVTQALGEVLLEEYYYESDGSLGNGTLIDYHLPTVADMPLLYEDSIIHVETPDPTTSFGQKGLGECATVTIFPAVANAVADATGIRFPTLPLSPSKVLPALIDAGLREL
jgi:CO/xanthine dehydrogenase Mo-binding subunit